MNKERIKTFIYCIVVPKDPISFEIEYGTENYSSNSSVSDWIIKLKLPSEFERNETLYLAAKEAVKLKNDGIIQWQFLFSLLDSLDIPYSVPRRLEEEKVWNDEFSY